MKFQLFIVAVLCTVQVSAWWPEFMSPQCVNGTTRESETNFDKIMNAIERQSFVLVNHTVFHLEHKADLALLKELAQNMNVTVDQMANDIKEIRADAKAIRDELKQYNQRTSNACTWFAVIVRVFLCGLLAYPYRYRHAMMGSYAILIISILFSAVVTTSVTAWFAKKPDTDAWVPWDLDFLGQFWVYIEAFGMVFICVGYFDCTRKSEANTDAIRGLGVLHATTNPTLDTARVNVPVVQSTPIKHIPASIASSSPTPIQHLPSPVYDVQPQSNIRRFLARRS